MFTHTQDAFGQFVAHHIKNPETNTGFSIVPGQGGVVLDIQFEGISILDGYQTPIELDLKNWGKSALLYPFPNRLKDGKYHWDGHQYQFPINDSQTENALHGLGVHKAMNIAKVMTSEKSGTIICQYNSKGEEEFYPFLFQFSAAFTITERGFDVELVVLNQDQESIPFGYGWHPYFTLGDSVETTELQLPKLDLIGIDQRMIPTGKRYPYEEFAQAKPIGATVLDNCFAVHPNAENKIEIQLKGSKGTLNYWQETKASTYPFVQIFTPPKRTSIAIEPMTCNVDAFNNQEGLIKLEAGEKSSARFGLTFQSA